MNGNGIDFERKFGEKWNAMEPDQRNMAVYLAITDFYAFSRRIDKKLSGLPCQDCEESLKVKTERVKGRYVLWAAAIPGGLSLVGVIILAACQFFGG